MGELTLPDIHNITDPVAIRGMILAFEDHVRSLPQYPLVVHQLFAPGVYLRMIVIPAGAMMTGNIHKHPCISIVVSGDMDVVTEAGHKRVTGPSVFVSPAGVKRAGIAHSTTIWATVHPYTGPELDADAMSDIFCVETFEQLDAWNQAQLEHKQ